MNISRRKQRKKTDHGRLVAIALNLRLFAGDAGELGDEPVSLLVEGPRLRAMFSISIRRMPAELTSAIVPKK